MTKEEKKQRKIEFINELENHYAKMAKFLVDFEAKNDIETNNTIKFHFMNNYLCSLDMCIQLLHGELNSGNFDIY